MADLDALQAHMVRSHLELRGIGDPRVLAAFRAVRREHFLPAGLAEFAYEDTALPLTEGQTVSQPYIVALTAESLGLKGHERVLEVGTGSGYAAAILGELAREVFTVERLPALAASARDRLREHGHENVQVKTGDGTLGWPEHAPFDAIAVAAGGPTPPAALLAQLAVGGILVMPVGELGAQQLVRITRVSQVEYRKEPLLDVRFVPLIGEQGFADRGAAPRRRPGARTPTR